MHGCEALGEWGGSDEGCPFQRSLSPLQIGFLRATLGKLPGDVTPGVVCYKAAHNNLTGSRTLKGRLILSPICFL